MNARLKTFTIIFVTLSVILILDSFNFGHALMLFVLAGIIPGTDIALSPVQTLELFALLTGIVVGRMSAALFSSLRRARYFQPTAAALEA